MRHEPTTRKSLTVGTGAKKTMTKIAITADLHMQAKKLDDIRRGWEELITHLINNKIPYFLIGGDLFSNYNIAGREASFGTVYSALAEPLRKYKQAGGYVYAIPGNHDIAGQNQRDALVSLEELITVVREPGGAVLAGTDEKIYVSFLPWMYNNAIPHEQLMPKAKRGYFNILLGHCELSGTQINNHYTIPVGGQFELPKEAFIGKGYDYIALGHIHKRLDYYIGAPWQTTFGEEGNHPGFVVLDVKGGKATESWIDLTSTRQYFTYNADNGSNIKLVPGKKGIDYVKIKYTNEPPQIELGSNVTLEKISTQRILRARTDISMSSTLREMIMAWMKENPSQSSNEPSIDEMLHVAGENFDSGNSVSSIGSLEYIESVRLRHVGPHVDTYVDFKGHNYIAISGHNGSGKTFTTDSIFAAFFGEFPSRGGSLFSKVTQGYDGVASIEVVFRSYEKRYSALRKFNNKGRHEALLTDLEINKIIAGPKVTDFDREIRRLVGSKDVVVASIFSAQKGVGDIVEAEPSDRKEILWQLLNINTFVDIAENTRKKANSLKAGIDAWQRRIDDIGSKNLGQQISLETQNIGALDKEFNALNHKIRSYSEDLGRITEEGQKLGAAIAKTEAYKKSVSGLQSEIVSLEKEMESLQKQLSTTRDIVLSETALNEKLKEINAAKSEHQGLLAKHEENLKTTAKLATIDGEIATEQTKISQEKDRIEKEIETLGEEIKTATAEYEKLIESYQSILKMHTDNQNNLKNAGCSKQPLPCPFINDAISSRKKAVEVQAQINQTKEASLKKRGDIELRIQQLSAILKRGDYAVEARVRLLELRKARRVLVIRPISEDRLSSLKKMVESEGETLSKLQMVKSGKEALIDLENRHTETHKKHIDKKAKESELTSEINKNEKLSTRYNELKTLWGNTTKLKDEAQSRLTEISASKAALAERIRQYEKELAELATLNQNIAAEAWKYKVHETVVRAFGKNGIPQLLIDASLPQMQDILNNILTQLDNKFTIRFATQQETQGGNIKEAIDILAGDELGERDVGDFSGGEQKLLKSIIRIALAVFQAQRHGSKYEVMIIDEIFDALDRDNALKVLQILYSLKNRFQQIIVVSHTDDLLIEFPVRLNFTKTHKGSTFSLIAA